MVRENGASIVELSSVNDDKHEKFYSGLGFHPADNFVLMSKFME
jgi:D-lyxose ketol-isomerase